MSENTIKVLLEISMTDRRVISSQLFPSTSAQSAQLTSNNNPKSMDMVFIYDTDVITMLSKRQMEVIKQEHPEFRLSFFTDKIERYLMTMWLNDSKEREKKVINIENMVDDGTDGSMFAEYENLKKVYMRYSNSTIDPEGMEYSSELIWFGHRWETAKQCLRLITERTGECKKYANVVLSKDGIAHGAIQLLYTSLSSDIQLENVYSTATNSAKSILETIQKKFGEQCKLVVIASNKDVIKAAQGLLIPYWPVHCNEDLNELYIKQRDVWLQQDPLSNFVEFQPRTSTTGHPSVVGAPIDHNNNDVHAQIPSSIHHHDMRVLGNTQNQVQSQPSAQNHGEPNENRQPTMSRQQRRPIRHHPFYTSYYYYYHHQKDV